ncbi:MAG: GTPase ObgE [Chthonomonas sp.]|nr:GTPase ObgE [Chthonomonas sp.]
MFFDEAIVEFVSGDGGSGAVAFHREKHVPRGGPNGADGGRGGNVILMAERGMRTLYDFSMRRKFSAEPGAHAVGNKRGRSSKDVIVKVPVGTVIWDTVMDEQLADLNLHGMKFVVCKGGRGGRGNLHYVSSVRQVPNFAEKGAPGETVTAKLELKLLADVGLIGLPNAGKSTLLGALSAARPKIGDYPFTTITPNLGVVSLGDKSFVMADMPGLIEGARLGHGLGHQFLRHIERTKVLIHVVDMAPIDESDPVRNFELIENELKEYSEEVWSRPRVVLLNKIDMIAPGSPENDRLQELRDRLQRDGIPVFAGSGAAKLGLDPMLYEVVSTLEAQESVESMPTLMPATAREEVDEGWDVVPAPEGGWEVIGRRVLRMVKMTNLNNTDSVRFLHRRLERMGVIERLRELGADEDDSVFVGDAVFSFRDY